METPPLVGNLWVNVTYLSVINSLVIKVIVRWVLLTQLFCRMTTQEKYDSGRQTDEIKRDIYACVWFAYLCVAANL